MKGWKESQVQNDCGTRQLKSKVRAATLVTGRQIGPGVKVCGQLLGNFDHSFLLLPR